MAMVGESVSEESADGESAKSKRKVDDDSVPDKADGRSIPKPDWFYNGHNSANWEAWCEMHGHDEVAINDDDNSK